MRLYIGPVHATHSGGLTMSRSVAFLLVAACLLQPSLAGAQGMSGDLIGTVKDAQGGVLTAASHGRRRHRSDYLKARSASCSRPRFAPAVVANLARPAYLEAIHDQWPQPRRVVLRRVERAQRHRGGSYCVG